MLPTGHIAAGYLTAKALLHFAHPALTSAQTNQLIVWGTFWGFAPDIDMFYFFIKHKTLLVAGKDAANDAHRKFSSHAPIYWLVVGLVIYFIATSVYWKYFGLMVWLGSWSHFILDSIEYGIPWLQPFSNRLFALRNLEEKLVIKESNFFKHSINFLKLYTTRISFYLEVLIIISSLIVFLSNH